MNPNNNPHQQQILEKYEIPQETKDQIYFPPFGCENAFEKILGQYLNLNINNFEIIDYQYRKEHTKYFKIFIKPSFYFSFSLQNHDYNQFPTLPQHKNIAKYVCTLKESDYFSSIHLIKSSQFIESVIVVNESALFSLEDLVKFQETKQIFSEQFILRVIQQLLQALIILQKYNIVHRDLKPSNILISASDFCFKLANFDVAIALNPLETTLELKSSAGSIAYMSPQLFNFYSSEPLQQNQLKEELYHPFQSDIYSLGLVILTMIGATDEEKILLRKDPNNKMIVLNKFQSMYPKLELILTQMLSFEEKDRPNFEDLLKFVQKVPMSNKINYKKWAQELVGSNSDAYCKKFASMDIREQINYLENISELYQKGSYYENSLRCLHVISKLENDMFYGSSEKIISILQAIGMNYNLMGNHKKSEVFYKLILLEYPELEFSKQMQIIEKLLQVYFNSKQMNKFDKLLIKAIEIVQNQLYSSGQQHLSFYVDLGILYLLQQNYVMSQKCFDKCLQDQTNLNDSLKYLEKIVDIHFKYNLYESALEFIEMILEIIPNLQFPSNDSSLYTIHTLYQKSICLILTGQYQQAELTFQQLIPSIKENDGLAVGIYYDCGTTYLSLQNFEEAEQYLTQAQQIVDSKFINLHPLSEQILQVLAQIKQNSKKFAKLMEDSKLSQNYLNQNLVTEQVCSTCAQPFLNQNMFYFCQKCNICVCQKCSQAILLEDDDDHKMDLIKIQKKKESLNDSFVLVIIQSQCLSCPQSWEIF